MADMQRNAVYSSKLTNTVLRTYNEVGYNEIPVILNKMVTFFESIRMIVCNELVKLVQGQSWELKDFNVFNVKYLSFV